jgi:hypothetical protein
LWGKQTGNECGYCFWITVPQVSVKHQS